MLIEYLKNAGLLSLLVLPFSLYLNSKKIGYKVAASYSWRVDTFTAPGIGTITLINMKDGPLAIFGIYAVVDRLCIKLKEFNPPLILKPMEAATIEADVVSKRYIGSEAFEWKIDFDKKHRIDIYLSTAWKTIKCRRHQGPSTLLSFTNKRGLQLITNSTWHFNDRIYNDNAKYAVIYTANGEQKTSLIDTGGIIDWKYIPNRLLDADMRSTDTVKAAIERCGISKVIAPFAVEELQTRKYATVFDDIF